MPWVQWDTPDRVRLFDLSADPSESINIAYDHTEVVEDMAARVRDIMKDAPPQMGAIHFRFGEMVRLQRRFAAAIVGITVLLLLLISHCVYNGCWGARARAVGKEKAA